MPRDVAVQGGCAWSGLSPLPVSSSTGPGPAKGELIWLSRCAGWLWSRANCSVESAGSFPSGWNSASPAAGASSLGAGVLVVGDVQRVHLFNVNYFCRSRRLFLPVHFPLLTSLLGHSCPVAGDIEF